MGSRGSTLSFSSARFLPDFTACGFGNGSPTSLGVSFKDQCDSFVPLLKNLSLAFLCLHAKIHKAQPRPGAPLKVSLLPTSPAGSPLNSGYSSHAHTVPSFSKLAMPFWTGHAILHIQSWHLLLPEWLGVPCVCLVITHLPFGTHPSLLLWSSSDIPTAVHTWNGSSWLLCATVGPCACLYYSS